MMYFKLLISLLMPFLLGIFGMAAILKKRLESLAYLERLAIAFAAGVWVLVLIMFGLPFIKVPLTFQNIALTAGLILSGLLPFSWKSLTYFLPKSLPRSKSFWFYLLLFIIIVKVLFVFWSALIKPMIDPDIIKCYALAAKQTFVTQAPWYPGLKPPLPFLIESWPPISLGVWNDTLLPLFYPFMYISLLVVFYSSLKRYFSETYSLFFTFLLASIPFLLFHAGTAYTDFPQAFYYSISTFYLFQFVKEFKSSKDKAPVFFLLCMLFFGISIWVKKSALLYYLGINLSVLALYLVLHWKSIQKKDWINFAYGAFLFAGISLPWLLYNKFITFGVYYGQAIPSLTQTFSFPRLAMGWAILLVLLRNMFVEGNWQLLWILFFSILILYPRKSFALPNIILVVIITLQLLALFSVFFSTDLFINVFYDTLLNRLMLHFAPVVLYFCAETLLSKS